MRKYKPSEEVDFLVLGSGAGGAVMAKQLALAGFSVVVLEQGPWGHYRQEQEHIKDELENHFSSPQELLTNDLRVQPNTFRRNAGEKAVTGTHIYGAVVGGGTVSYGASSWRHLPYEFNEASTFGTFAGTGVADWPLGYDELEPYYTQAEWELGISGQRVNAPYFAPMSKDYPLPPLPLKSSGALFKTAAAKLGLHVVPNVAAILTRPYMGRSACNNCGMCSGYGCQTNAKSSSAAALLPFAEATGRCEIRANAYAREIVTDKSGKATGVVYFEKDSNNREVMQKAKVVVLAASASESPRLLLLSKSNRFPHGLANSSGVVGKYMMCGNYGGATGLFEHPLNEFKGCVTGAAILDYVPNDPRRGFYGGGRMTARGFVSPMDYGLGGVINAPSWGAGYKKALMEQANRRLTIANFVTQMPLETNTVDLDPDVKDAWGLPALRITTTSHPNDMQGVRFFTDKAVEILKAAGATDVAITPVDDTKGGAHIRGTCRMGNDPRTSVVNKYQRAHDVPNLFIVDGSAFVTGGRNHPTLTISALAYRAADHLVAAAKTGNVKI